MNDDSKEIVAGGPFLHKRIYPPKAGFISEVNKYLVLKHELSVPQQFGLAKSR